MNQRVILILLLSNSSYSSSSSNLWNSLSGVQRYAFKLTSKIQQMLPTSGDCVMTKLVKNIIRGSSSSSSSSISLINSSSTNTAINDHGDDDDDGDAGSGFDFFIFDPYLFKLLVSSHQTVKQQVKRVF